jgi:hypothetical protein
VVFVFRVSDQAIIGRFVVGTVFDWNFALSGEVRFFAPPKKSTQKKGGPEGLPGHSSAMTVRVPCASRHFGRSPNSQDLPRLRLANPARQDGSLDPKMPAMLGGA